MERNVRWESMAATLAVAAVLTTGAAVTVDRAGCDEPGQWLQTAESVELVGSCLDSADLPVAPVPTRPAPVERPFSLDD